MSFAAGNFINKLGLLIFFVHSLCVWFIYSVGFRQQIKLLQQIVLFKSNFLQKVENQFYFCTTECGVLILECQQGSVGLYLVFWLKSIWEPQIRFHGHDHGNLARKHSMYPLQQSTSNNGYRHKPRLKYGFGNGGFKLYLVWLFYNKQCHKTPYNQKLANAFSDKLR